MGRRARFDVPGTTRYRAMLCKARTMLSRDVRPSVRLSSIRSVLDQTISFSSNLNDKFTSIKNASKHAILG